MIVSCKRTFGVLVDGGEDGGKGGVEGEEVWRRVGGWDIEDVVGVDMLVADRSLFRRQMGHLSKRRWRKMSHPWRGRGDTMGTKR
jgi:hypothetical protein